MKWKSIILVFLILPLVLAEGIGDESIITTGIQVQFDTSNPEEARLIISGENLIWSKTITYNRTVLENHTTPFGFGEAWTENLEIIMIRRLGNYSDVQYAIIECNKMANFSREWRICVDQRERYEIQILNDMINKSEYESLKNNMTEQISSLEVDRNSKDGEIDDLKSKNEELEGNKKRGWYLGIGGLAIGGWLLYKYKGWGKGKNQFEKEFPSDVPA